MTDQTTTPSTETTTKTDCLQFQRESFRAYVQDMDLSPEQQDALLDAVWLIMIGVIDLGLGAYQFAGDGDDSKPLAVDSASVLALLSTNKITNAEDVEAQAPIAPRMDS